MFSRISTFLLAINFLVACSGFGPFAPETTKKPAPSKTADTDDEGTIDKPVPVSGSFLTCSVDAEATGTQPSYGCRLEANGAKVQVPSSATAEITFTKDNAAVPTQTAKAATDAFWQWLVTANVSGPFAAKLKLSNVSVTTNPTLQISAGKGHFEFEQAVVEGSTFTWPTDSTTSSLTLLTNQTKVTDSNWSIPVESAITAFPKYLKGQAPVSGVVTVGFVGSGVTEGSTMTCTYKPSSTDPAYYVYAGNCKNAGVEDGFTWTPNDPVFQIKEWFIEMSDSRTFTITGTVRKYGKYTAP